MSRHRLLFRLLFKAAWGRRDRALTALISVAVVAAIATASLTVYSGLEGRLSHDFRGFGPNVIVTRSENSFTQADLAAMWAIVTPKIALSTACDCDVVPIAYALARTSDGKPVVVGGADLKNLDRMNSWWSTRQVSSNGSALLGSRAAEQLSPSGAPFTLAIGARTLAV